MSVVVVGCVIAVLGAALTAFGWASRRTSSPASVDYFASELALFLYGPVMTLLGIGAVIEGSVA